MPQTFSVVHATTQNECCEAPVPFGQLDERHVVAIHKFREPYFAILTHNLPHSFDHGANQNATMPLCEQTLQALSKGGDEHTCALSMQREMLDCTNGMEMPELSILS